MFDRIVPLQHVLSEPVERATTALSLGTLAGWMVGVLPAVSLAVTALWGLLKCYECIQTIRLNNQEKQIKSLEIENLKKGLPIHD
jgi:hypothetical protein